VPGGGLKKGSRGEGGNVLASGRGGTEMASGKKKQVQCDMNRWAWTSENKRRSKGTRTPGRKRANWQKEGGGAQGELKESVYRTHGVGRFRKTKKKKTNQYKEKKLGRHGVDKCVNRRGKTGYPPEDNNDQKQRK